MKGYTKQTLEMDALHPFAPQKEIFRAYDIRGDYRYFTNDFLYSLAICLVNSFESKILLKNVSRKPSPKSIVIGYDMRDGSLKIAQYLAAIFSKNGFAVVWLGLVTTPIMAYWAVHENIDQQNGIMVTASHSGKNIAGIKWLINNQSPTKAEILAIYDSMSKIGIHLPTLKEINNEWLLNQQNITIIKNPELLYQQGIQTAINTINKGSRSPKINMAKLNTIVIDCLNGTTANFAKALYAPYAQNIIVINDIADGNFPKGNPDPCEKHRLNELQTTVIAHKADLGLAFDGDGDRIMVVDDCGNVIVPDHLLYLLAKTAIEQLPKNFITPLTKSKLDAPEVIFDVKCSHHLPNMLTEIGSLATMSKTGSSHMRHSMQTGKSEAIFAGELSGHFIFNDGLFINYDDAMYAGIRLINWLLSKKSDGKISLQNSRLPISSLIEQLPTMVSTADTYIKVSQQQLLLSSLLNILKDWFNDKAKLSKTLKEKLPKETKISTIDGIRLDFANGFGIIRQSNTSQSLTVRFSANTLNDLKKIQQSFSKMCQQLDENLAISIANIKPITD